MFDFSHAMSSYESIAIFLSVIALLIPILSFLWKKFFVKAKIEFIPSSSIKIYFNRSGAYLYLGGAIESKHLQSTIKNIDVKVKRIKDSSILDLNWSSFISPVFQYVGNSSVIANETARAFQVPQNGVVPIFVEFASENASINGPFNMIHTDIINLANTYDYISVMNKMEQFEKAKIDFTQNSTYKKYYPMLLQNLFWLKGEYNIELKIKYNNSVYVKNYGIDITEQEAEKIQNNVELSMLVSLYDRFELRYPAFYIIHKEYEEV